MTENKLLIRILADNKQAKAQLGQLESSLEKMRGALQRVGRYGAIAFSGWQLGGAAAEVVRLTESMNALQARLRIVTASAREIMDDADIEYVKLTLSSTHPVEDICDLHARVDKYSLGPGV
jgi:hypothetical protein